MEEKKADNQKKEKNKKNYKFIPNVKICINTLNQIKANIVKKKEIFALCYISEKELLYSGGTDQSIHIWNIDTGVYINTLKVS